MHTWCCNDSTARIYLSADLVTFRVAPADLLGLLREAVQRRGLSTPVEVIAETATHCRWVHFHPEAGVITFAVSG